MTRTLTQQRVVNRLRQIALEKGVFQPENFCVISGDPAPDGRCGGSHKGSCSIITCSQWGEKKIADHLELWDTRPTFSCIKRAQYYDTSLQNTYMGSLTMAQIYQMMSAPIPYSNGNGMLEYIKFWIPKDRFGLKYGTLTIFSGCLDNRKSPIIMTADNQIVGSMTPDQIVWWIPGEQTSRDSEFVNRIEELEETLPPPQCSRRFSRKYKRQRVAATM